MNGLSINITIGPLVLFGRWGRFGQTSGCVCYPIIKQKYIYIYIPNTSLLHTSTQASRSSSDSKTLFVIR